MRRSLHLVLALVACVRAHMCVRVSVCVRACVCVCVLVLRCAFVAALCLSFCVSFLCVVLLVRVEVKIGTSNISHWYLAICMQQHTSVRTSLPY